MTYKLSYSVFEITSENTYHARGYRIRRVVDVGEVEIFTRTDKGKYIKLRESIGFLNYISFLRSLKRYIENHISNDKKINYPTPIYIIYEGAYVSVDALPDDTAKAQLLKYIDEELSSPMSQYLIRHFLYYIRGNYVLKTGYDEFIIQSMVFKHNELRVKFSEEVVIFEEPVSELNIPYSWILFSYNNSNLTIKVPHPFNPNKTLFKFKIEEDGIL